MMPPGKSLERIPIKVLPASCRQIKLIKASQISAIPYPHGSRLPNGMVTGLI
jgi:hypothetical protein